MNQKFQIEMLPEVIEFLENLDEKTRRKIYYNLKKSQFITDDEIFKKINKFIWEFRTIYGNKSYRLFAFWDNREKNNSLVIATHGIIKKTNKTPLGEIKKAEDLRANYFKT